MDSAVIQLLVLAGIAIFLILRLRSVLGTREGYERPPEPLPGPAQGKPTFDVIEGGMDHDITDHAPRPETRPHGIPARPFSSPPVPRPSRNRRARGR